ncbi:MULTISPECIES: iron ABC transporter permease [Haloferax]|uniref:ABC transporter permease subunit n=1 Tax=Haloferax marinum TaxID=2666143 RepID=A0A6A8G5U6_9EURY|nr:MULTISPECIES: iron ABC transporter permease [Haloferax]KAB1197134.1 iron ABC transporter permease [Haloferax sp. CBA1150]MRW96167.1 ABC transporter permease subunit [Haloferax marinum]
MSSKRPLAEAAAAAFDRLPGVETQFDTDSEPVKGVILGVVVAVVVGLTVVPLVFLLWTSVWSGYPGEFGARFTLENFRAVYLEGFFPVVELVANSLIVAVGMTGTGLVFGLGAAWLFVRTNLPTKGEMELVLLSCQTIPGYVYAIMYVTTYGADNGILATAVREAFGLASLPVDIFNPWAIAFIAGINVVPTFYLLTVPALQDMDPALEEVSRIHGASVRETVRSVTFPLIKPAILSGSIVIFLYGMGEFAVVSILGVRNGFDVYSTTIFTAIKGRFPAAYGQAAALACSLLLMMLVFVWYYRKVTSRKEDFMTLTGRRHNARVWDLGRWRWPLAAGIWALLLVVWVVPIVALVVTSLHVNWYGEVDLSQLTLAHYVTVLTDPQLRKAFVNSLLVAGGGATLGTVLVIGMAYYTERTKARLRGFVDFLSLTPLAVPGIITGAGLLFTFLWVGKIHPLLDWYGTLAIIIVGSVMVFLPMSSRIAVGNIVQIHDDLEEAARVAGASWLQGMREVFLPLFRNTAVVLWFFLAMHIVQLLSIPMMTYTSKTIVIPVKLFELYTYGSDITLVAAISSLFILLTVVFLIGLRLTGITFYELGQQ